MSGDGDYTFGAGSVADIDFGATLKWDALDAFKTLYQWFFTFLTVLPILDILKNQITPLPYIAIYLFNDQYTYKLPLVKEPLLYVIAIHFQKVQQY